MAISVKKWSRRLTACLRLLPIFIRLKGSRDGARAVLKAGVIGAFTAIRDELFGIENQLFLDANKLKDLRFIIHAPNYVSTSAGVHCVYRLCDDLNKLGVPSAICGSAKTSKELNAPLIFWRDAKRLLKYENRWVLYSETISGNPTNAKNVVRWVLNRPGLLGGEETYENSEKVFVYSDQYRNYVKNQIAGKLQSVNLDRDIFYPPSDPHAARPLKCFYVGKSKYKSGVLDRKEVLEITRNFPKKNELGKILRASSILYTFDNSTALTYEAIACGCRVMIIPDGTQTFSDFEKLELGTYGIHWNSQPDVEEVINPSDLFSRLEQLEIAYTLQIQNMINQTLGSSTAKV